MQEEINSLKKKRTAHLVLSSPSSAHDDDSAASSDDMGDSPKQGRKTDARTEGRKLDFEQGLEDFGGFEGFDFSYKPFESADEQVEEAQGTEEISQQQQQTEEMAQDAPTEIVDLDAQVIPEDFLDTTSSQPKV